jgi:NDP-sugar pyrophosphorylase family protein
MLPLIMDLVICMAGKNTRFHDLGYDIPKYLLPFPKTSVIQNIINYLDPYKIFSEIFLVAHERDIHFKPDLLNSLDALGISENNLFYVGETSGQAETAYLATNLIKRKKDSQIVIHNADTVLFDRDLTFIKSQLIDNYGFVDTFYSNSENYSYVKLNEDKITEIVEKKVISQHATSGLYGFTSLSDYQKYYSEYKRELDINSTSEIYISEIIKFMISKGKIFKTKLQTLNQNTIVLGSPKEYIEALKILK